MLLIAELALFGGGLFLAISGKAGAWIAGKGYTLEGGKARLIGVILALPLPLAVCAGVVVGIINPDLLGSIWIVEWLMVIGSAIIAAVMIRSARKPIDSNQSIMPPTPPNIEPK